MFPYMMFDLLACQARWLYNYKHRMIIHFSNIYLAFLKMVNTGSIYDYPAFQADYSMYCLSL